MNKDLVKKIAVVGPESTGKSTISSQLADHYQTVWVPEFAREYCSKLLTPCTMQDELNMFYGQLALEDEMLSLANKILICDTTILTVKIWSDHTFGYTPAEVLNKLAEHPYDLYLLMDIDLPWQNDPLREFPDLRQHFMDIWQRELASLKGNYTVISGTEDQRLKNAVEAVDRVVISL
jgi:NadR type nicotinamide-nucleotide adenylyltransferase